MGTCFTIVSMTETVFIGLLGLVLRLLFCSFPCLVVWYWDVFYDSLFRPVWLAEHGVVLGPVLRWITLLGPVLRFVKTRCLCGFCGVYWDLFYEKRFINEYFCPQYWFLILGLAYHFKAPYNIRWRIWS